MRHLQINSLILFFFFSSIVIPLQIDDILSNKILRQPANFDSGLGGIFNGPSGLETFKKHRELDAELAAIDLSDTDLRIRVLENALVEGRADPSEIQKKNISFMKAELVTGNYQAVQKILNFANRNNLSLKVGLTSQWAFSCDIIKHLKPAFDEACYQQNSTESIVKIDALYRLILETDYNFWNGSLNCENPNALEEKKASINVEELFKRSFRNMNLEEGCKLPIALEDFESLLEEKITAFQATPEDTKPPTTRRTKASRIQQTEGENIAINGHIYRLETFSSECAEDIPLSDYIDAVARSKNPKEEKVFINTNGYQDGKSCKSFTHFTYSEPIFKTSKPKNTQDPNKPQSR
jgi:hypothetical protein